MFGTNRIRKEMILLCITTRLLLLGRWGRRRGDMLELFRSFGHSAVADLLPWRKGIEVPAGMVSAIP